VTLESLKTDLTYLAKQAGLDMTDLDAHVDFCIATGLAEFWNCYGWTWRTRPYELTITAVAEEYVLPTDFGGIRTVREKTSTAGGTIVYVPKEQFDQQYPRPTAWTDSYPMVCTAYHDRKRANWYIKFMRPPTIGCTIYIDMFTTTGVVDGVPEGFVSGLFATIEKYLYKPGTPQRFAAQAYAQSEIERLQRTDGPFIGNLTNILQMPQPESFPSGRRPW
jgi:hypothetical protein